MKRRDVIRLLNMLHAKNISSTPESEWVIASCPLASKLHPKGKDEHPSFGILVNEHGASRYRCFVCGAGSLFKLLHNLTWLYGWDKEISNFIAQAELESESTEKQYFDVYIGNGNTMSNEDTPVKLSALIYCPLLSESVGYDTERVMEWLLNRGIAPDVVYDYGLRLYPVGSAVVFPYREPDGTLFYLRARSIESKDFYFITPSILGMDDEVKWGKKDSFFGMDKVDTHQPIVLVESETDVLRLATLGVDNVIATGGSISKHQLKRIQGFEGEVILGFDSDEKGVAYCKEVMKVRMSAPSPQYSFKRYSWKKVGCKDAGELKSLEQLEEVVGQPNIIELGEKIPKLKMSPYRDKY